MKKEFKFLLAFLIINATLIFGAFSQQLTRFGVVDTAKVYNAYFRNSAPIRNYEKKKTEFQAEINKRTEELRQLQLKKLELENDGNESQVLKIEAEITKKREYLTEYANAKNVELETMQRSLQTSDDFYKKLYDVLARIAESGGYSMILSLQDDNSILWYSQTVDVTNQVISELGL